MRTAASLALTWTLLAPARAPAQAPILPAALTDVVPAVPALEEEAAAATLLVRSLLQPRQRQLVARRELAQVVAGLGTGGTPAPLPHLGVPEEASATLSERLLVDRVITLRLSQSEDRLELTGSVFDGKGSKLRAVSASAPAGALHFVARQAARQIAAAIDADVLSLSGHGLSLGALRPFASALRLATAGDASAAARALDLAPPGFSLAGPDAPPAPAARGGWPVPAGALAAIRELGQLLWADPALSAEERVQVALATGDAQAARTLADRALKEGARAGQVRAARLLAQLGLGDVKGVERELRQGRGAGAPAELGLADLALAVATRAPPAERDSALTSLLSDARLAPRALALCTALPPGTFGPEAERALLDRTLALGRQLGPGESWIVPRLALRALANDVDAARALEHVRLADLDLEDADLVRAPLDRLALTQAPAAQTLQRALDARRALAQELRLAAVGATGLADHLALTTALAPVLEALPRLREGDLGQLVLVPLAGSGQPLYLPWKARPEVLRTGLGVALAGPALGLPVALAPEEPPVAETALVPDALIAQARRLLADALVLYRLRATGSQAEVSVILADGKTGQQWTATGTLPGRSTGLLAPNPLPWMVLVLLLATTAVLLGKRALSGSLVVHVKEDPEASEALLCLKLSRSPDGPAVGSPVAFAERVRKLRPGTAGREAFQIGARTQLGGLPRGTWWVHLYGTYKRTGATVVVEGKDFSREVEVRAGRSAAVHFSMEATHATLALTVTDGSTPVAGAEVWLDQDQRETHRTGADGTLSLDLPRGKHVVSVQARGLCVDRTLDVVATRPYALSVDLGWERQRGGAARPAPPSPAQGVAPLSTDARALPLGAASLFALAPPAGPPSGATAQATVALPGQPRLPSYDAQPAAPPPSLGLSLQAGTTGGTRMPGIDLGGGGAASPGFSAPAVAPSVATAPSALDRYRRLDKLGAGAMGVVYRARDTVLDRDVALKIMSPDIRDNPEVAAKFQQEAKALAALNHPNIVTVYDQGSAGGELFMVMELVEGPGALDDILAKRERLPLPEALDVTDQLCAAIGYAHKRRIIHRDIKPANMFLTHDGVVKVGDFGLARAIGAMKITKTVIQGTPLYMSPEQILGRDVDFRADLYAIGCTLFECLTGQPPFIEGEVLYHHMHTPPPAASSLCPGLPADLDALIARCLVKDKEQRIQSADEIRAGLRQVREALR